jgi:hypothetical protein
MPLNKARQQLNRLYIEVKQVILSKQHPVTGLLPASTAVNSHGNYTDAWVRDNVYSIVAPWALGLAFRRSRDEQRADELEQATIKLMRGLLQSMMRQAPKVEKFKHTLDPLDSLHAKYETATGLTVVADDAWGHLQIDATSIFLLMLAQMSASGLRIIRTYDEVDFVQNLIYYIAAAYRIPDYGIWERGNKINNGNPEINASSVGMAKAALQALDGLNLFGPHASKRAVVHTIADAISLARNSLAALLPRESLSKEVDSALLSTIGFPAFAVGDAELSNRTRDEILKKLGGEYGLKRFLWDGHQTVIEDPSRLYYEHSELANFEHIESEWPLFYCYLYLNALFDGNAATAKHYREKIESIMVDKGDFKLIPELYFLEKEHIEAEKKSPRSQVRSANENLPLVWAQSLFYTGLLIDEGFISADELDAVNLRRRTTRYRISQVALVVLAENERVKQTLADNGVIAESLDDIAPLKVISAPHLVEAYAKVGANEALGLSGRPKRRLQSLASSQTYEINGQKFLCLSWVQSGDDDYRMFDAKLISAILRKEIAHIRKHWLNAEVSVFTFMINEEFCNSLHASELYRCLQSFQLKTEDEYVGYASGNLAYRASRENKLHAPGICLNPLSQNDEQSDLDPRRWDDKVKKILSSLSADEQRNYAATQSLIRSAELSDSASDVDANLTLRHAVEEIYRFAYLNNQWLLARYCFIFSGKKHADLADYLSVLSARHFSVIVGSARTQEFGLKSGLSNDEIITMLEQASTSEIELCVLQEILEAIGVLQRTSPRIFDGLRSIHLHNMLRLCANRESREDHAQMVLNVAGLSPAELLEKIEKILRSHRSAFTMGMKQSFSLSDTQVITSGIDGQAVLDMDWFEWRSERGMIVSLERDFLEKVWQSLKHTPNLVLGEANNPESLINSELVLGSMTPGEEIFARLIDDALAQLHPPYFKSGIVEVLMAFTQFCDEHKNARFKDGVILADILEKAGKEFCFEEGQTIPSTRDIDQLLKESPDKIARYFENIFVELATST